MKPLKLPDKPSELLTLAKKDLKKAEKSPAYRIRMGGWHTPRAKYCSVCMAGAVMAFSLKIAKNLDIMPSDEDRVDIETGYKLLAIDSFRTGFIFSGLEHMGINVPRIYRYYISVPEYSKSPKKRAAFYEGIDKVITHLKEIGQ